MSGKELVKEGLIEPVVQVWSYLVLLVKKKYGGWTFCFGYMRLNADVYSLRRIDDSLDVLAGRKYLCTLKLVSGYWQAPLTPNAQRKCALSTRSGLENWKVMPFGMASALATFC